MGTCKVWLAFEQTVSGKTFRKALDGYPCEIQGVTMVVHKVPPNESEKKTSKPKWRVSDPFTGYKATPFMGDSRKIVIEKVRGYVSGLTEREGKSFQEIMESKRKEYGSVMDLPERTPDGIEESVPA